MTSVGRSIFRYNLFIYWGFCKSGVRVSPGSSPIWQPRHEYVSARPPFAHCPLTRHVPGLRTRTHERGNETNIRFGPSSVGWRVRVN